MTRADAFTPVGTVFYVVGRAPGGYGCDWPDWVRRILEPQAHGNGNGNGRAWNVGVDTAEADLALAVRLGLVHESLVEEPRRAA